jgi:hypothetical protein
MKSKEENIKITKVLVSTMLELLIALKYSIIKELGKIATIVVIIIPVVLSSIDISIFMKLLISVCFVSISKYIREVGYKLNETNSRSMPISSIRFTYEDEYGVVRVSEDYAQEAILYLYDVEEYLKQTGKVL